MRRAASLLILAWLANPADAQDMRISGSSSARYIELRPLVRDSIEASSAEGEGLLRQLPDGRVVRCLPGESYCWQVRPGQRVSMVPMIHDVNVSAWGVGRGLALHSQLRGRTAAGEAGDVWPRAETPFEVMSLYAELERGEYRARVGRQWRVSGLGFYNFDGLSVAVRPRPSAWLEVYGGRSLSRGLNEGRTSAALESVEDLSAPDAGILIGAQARYRPNAGLQVGAVYQLDIRADRTGGYSELAAVDGAWRTRRGSADASVELNLSTGTPNVVRAAYRSPPLGNAAVVAELRRYRPYFELWTIWGAFSPVGFDEVRTGVTWASPEGRLLLRGEGAFRRYEDPGTDAVDRYEDSGWGAGLSGSWTPNREWRASASYRVEAGFGAARWEADAGLRRDTRGGNHVAVFATSFRRLYEFRLGEGTVIGGGAEGSIRMGDRARAVGTLLGYRQSGGIPGSLDWNQRRASIRLEWVVGSEPRNVGPGRARR